MSTAIAVVGMACRYPDARTPLELWENVLAEVELAVEVGPGQVLTGLVSAQSELPVFSVDAADPSLRGLLQVLGAAYAAGCPLNREALFAGRLTRPFNLDWQPLFFVNSCEAAPRSDSAVTAIPTAGWADQREAQ